MPSKTSRSHRALPVSVADFETTTTEDDCRVWAWASVEVNNFDNIEYGIDIESYVDFALRRPQVIYFHNLAFDATFILDFLLKNGYECVRERPAPGEFTSLISNMGKFYSITVVSQEGHKVEFRDSLKLYPMSVSRIAKSFGFEEQKLELDYEAYREPGHELTEHERNYITADIIIVAKALRLAFAQGMKKLTIGAEALAEYKRLSNRGFRKFFPLLPKNMDDDVRRAYRGGWTYANKRYAGLHVGAGAVYDVNSLYPYVMHDRPCPIGLPRYVDELPSSGLFIASITFTAKLKEGHLPCIQMKKNLMFNPTEYIEEVAHPATAVVTSVDLALWEDQYDFDILSVNNVLTFESAEGVFTDYIDKWMKIKAQSKGGVREIAKLHLNSLYGKMATNTNVTGKYPTLEHDRVVLKLGPYEEREPVYTPAGVFITAWARDHTIRACQANYDRFLYADTDSMHVLGLDCPSGITVDDKELGAWKQEGLFSDGVYVRAKQYSERMTDGTVSTHIAGLPSDLANTVKPEDLLTDQEWHGKLIPTRVPGGVVLKPTSFRFTARKR